MHFGKNFKSHPNLDLRNFSIKIFPKYYQEIIYRWSKCLSSPYSLPSSITLRFLWLNTKIQIDNKCLIFFNFVRHCFVSDVKVHCWKFLKEKYLFSQNTKFKSQSNFEKIFENSNLDWRTIYLLLRIATVDTIILLVSTKYSTMFCFYIKCYIGLELCKICYANFAPLNSNTYILQL